MENKTEDLLEKMVLSISSLPGIGRKSAYRISFHLLRMNPSSFHTLVDNLIESKNKIQLCVICGGFTQNKICELCSSNSRKSEILCIVEEAEDILFIEKTNEFFGKYHVLNGAISPINGIGPEQLRIKELIERIKSENIQEILIATNPNLEGDTTADYLFHILKESNIKITRIAHGIAFGGSIGYSDQYSLGRAIRTRLSMNSN